MVIEAVGMVAVGMVVVVIVVFIVVVVLVVVVTVVVRTKPVLKVAGCLPLTVTESAAQTCKTPRECKTMEDERKWCHKIGSWCPTITRCLEEVRPGKVTPPEASRSRRSVSPGIWVYDRWGVNMKTVIHLIILGSSDVRSSVMKVCPDIC
jgi:hypothetical protein